MQGAREEDPGPDSQNGCGERWRTNAAVHAMAPIAAHGGPDGREQDRSIAQAFAVRQRGTTDRHRGQNVTAATAIGTRHARLTPAASNVAMSVRIVTAAPTSGSASAAPDPHRASARGRGAGRGPIARGPTDAPARAIASRRHRRIRSRPERYLPPREPQRR